MRENTIQDLDNVRSLKDKLDKSEMEISDVPKEYIRPLCALYDVQIDKLKKEIQEIRKEKEEYRKRMEVAIKNLKNNSDE